MTYAEAIKFLYSHAPMFSQHGKAAYKTGLDNTLALDAHFAHPHTRYRTIHVAGTNGKGSVSHLLASVLQCAGYKVGLYTSPHLHDFSERIRVNGTPISEQRICTFVSDNRPLIEQMQPSFFEITTALAFLYFAECQVDIAIVEVGLGGRLDCTNIIKPALSVITNISLDHTDILGDTLEKIATEKAGIIKPCTPVVVGETQPETEPIFRDKAVAEKAPIVFADKIARDTLPACALQGIYQEKNRRTALAALEILQKNGWEITQQHIANGFAQVIERTHLQGRWQTLSERPKVVCDTGHNEGGMRYVANQLKAQKFNQLHIVFGMVRDKNIDAVLQLLPQHATYYFAQAQNPRALPAATLQQRATAFGLNGKSYSTVNEAFNAAKKAATADDFIFVGGSNYVIGELDF